LADFGKVKLSEAAVMMPHAGHEQHLCFLQNIGMLKGKTEEFKKLIQNPKYVCKDCGRSATNAENLCNPEKL
jgi:hypothetical protein